MKDLYDMIVAVVDKHSPIDPGQLSPKLVEEFGLEVYDKWESVQMEDGGEDMVASLVEAGRLIEILYFLPGLRRGRSLLLPAGTEIRVNRGPADAAPHQEP